MKWQQHEQQEDVLEPMFAYIGPDDQVWIQDRNGLRRSISFGAKESTWPRWSPDGKWLLYFHSSAEGIVVSICSIDGFEEFVLETFTEEIPIFAYWSPKGDKVLLLTQGIELSLWLCDIEMLGNIELLETGGTIFFCWDQYGSSVCVHVAHDGGSQLVRHYMQHKSPEIISHKTGFFCVPILKDEDVFFVERDGDYAHIRLLQGGNRTTLHQREGYTSMSLSPSMEYIALSGAEDKIEILNTESGTVQQVADISTQSVWWTPNSQQLLYSLLDTRKVSQKWYILDIKTQESRLVHEFWPTRAQVFVLHFFEQFKLVQPIVESSGQQIIFGGYSSPQGTQGYTPQALIYSYDLFSETVIPIAEGSFPSLIPYV